MTIQEALLNQTIEGLQFAGNTVAISLGSNQTLFFQTDDKCDHIHVYATPSPLQPGSMLTPLYLPCKPYIVADLPAFTPMLPPPFIGRN